MSMAIDPVCGMRIDAHDAVARAVHGGDSYYFCSEGCHDAFVTQPEVYRQPAHAKPERTDERDLALEDAATADYMRRMERLGIVRSQDGTYSRQDIVRARVVAKLETLGIEPEALARALASGHLKLGYLESAGRRHPRSAHTFAEIADHFGVPFSTLERVYVAFGLPSPSPAEHVRQEDLEAVGVLPTLFAAGLDVEDVLRMARVWGDSVRRLAQYLPHYFHTAVEERFRRRGMGDNDAYEAALREVGARTGRSGEDLLGWLFRRHSEVFMTEHQYGHVEAALEAAGVRRRPPRGVEAAVFADLVGYTQLTEEAGDEAAVEAALTLAQLVGDVAVRHRGTVVKLLGDGVYLHFRDPADAVRASLDVAVEVPASGLPPVRVGVNAGPILYDQGDYFGRTVNVAARIAAQAGPGQVFVGEEIARSASGATYRLHDLGEFKLKGIAKPVRVFEALPQ